MNKELKFESDKDELEYYREMKNTTLGQLSDEIHELVGIDKEYSQSLYLMAMGKSDLIRLKNAIKKKLNSGEEH